MKQPEQYVVSLHWAKELAKRGYKEECLFYFKVGKATGTVNITDNAPDLDNWTKTDEHFEWYPAPTSGELFEALPASTCLVKKTDLETKKVVRYYAETFDFHPAISPNLYDENTANALAILACSLHDEKLLDLSKI